MTYMRIGALYCFVRENVQYDSFVIGSGVRLGMKQGQMPPDAIQVLELALRLHPKSYKYNLTWDRIANRIQEIDPQRRKVVNNNKFTVKTALNIVKVLSVSWKMP